MQTEQTLAQAVAKSKMDVKTARKYLKQDRLPEELKKPHVWRTRKDPFENVWQEIREMLELNPGLEAKTLFEHFVEKYPGCFRECQLRTLQRKIKEWRATEGPQKEVFFPQVHYPGKLCSSDFTCMNSFLITINKKPYGHLIYHFTLTWSNWETGKPCVSESFESLSDGLQSSLWKLGSVPEEHLSDRLSAAVNNLNSERTFTERYGALLRHYGLTGRKTNPSSPHENGDVEQRNHRLKRTMEQALLLRGSRDFESQKEYEQFLDRLFDKMNTCRKEKLEQELAVMKKLPLNMFESSKRLVNISVSRNSTIRVNHNIYSVDSRLIGEKVDVYLGAENLNIYYGRRCVDILPRIFGENRQKINYRHIIDWLVRKPGAFANYRYQEEMFPTFFFRSFYDHLLNEHTANKAAKEYLKVLHLAAKTKEELVDRALQCMCFTDELTTADEITDWVMKSMSEGKMPDKIAVAVEPVDVSIYDGLLRQGVSV
jgi:hypothetical protein